MLASPFVATERTDALKVTESLRLRIAQLVLVKLQIGESP
jgi:hypothetical protein